MRMSLLSLLFSRLKCWFAFGCCISLYYPCKSKPPGAGGLVGAVSNCSEAREHFNNMSSKIPCCVSGQEEKRKQEGLWLCCDCQLEVNNSVLCLRRCLLCTVRGERSVCLNSREVCPLNQGISLIQGMSLPSQTIALEASLIIFFFGSGSWAGDGETCSSNFCSRRFLQQECGGSGGALGNDFCVFLAMCTFHPCK